MNKNFRLRQTIWGWHIQQRLFPFFWVDLYQSRSFDYQTAKNKLEILVYQTDKLANKKSRRFFNTKFLYLPLPPTEPN